LRGWTIIRIEDCEPYLAALDQASVEMNMRPFATFVSSSMLQQVGLSMLWERRSRCMAKAKEFRVRVEDKLGALRLCCVALAERGVNILAFQSFVEQGESSACFVVDDPASAPVVLNWMRANFEQDDVAVVTIEHRPGELGRAALR
jgi:hypothetical protein